MKAKQPGPIAVCALRGKGRSRPCWCPAIQVLPPPTFHSSATVPGEVGVREAPFLQQRHCGSSSHTARTRRAGVGTLGSLTRSPRFFPAGLAAAGKGSQGPAWPPVGAESKPRAGGLLRSFFLGRMFLPVTEHLDTPRVTMLMAEIGDLQRMRREEDKCRAA